MKARWLMLMPLIVLAAGSILAGWPFYEYFAGHHVQEFFRQSLASKATPSSTTCIMCRSGDATPTVMMASASRSPISSICAIRASRSGSRAQHQLLYRFLLNKWYFDELYDFIFVRPAKWLGYTLWKRGDGWLIDGFGPDGVSARVLDVTRNVVRLQTGYLYHYAFAMLIGAAL